MWREAGGRERKKKRERSRRKRDVSCADGLREHRSKFHAVMSLQKQAA